MAVHLPGVTLIAYNPFEHEEDHEAEYINVLPDPLSIWPVKVEVRTDNINLTVASDLAEYLRVLSLPRPVDDPQPLSVKTMKQKSK